MRLTLWPLRLLVTGHLVAVLAQPVLAGRFLTGDVDAIAVHGAVGSSLAAAGLVLVVAASVYVLAGRGRVWVAPAAVVLLLAEGVQIGAGYTRNLALHVPLGVTVVVASVLLAIWVWTPSAGRVR
ncbi:hypothetical protein GCM10017691_50520 [Pseudonocardia petroleophila]